MARKNKSRREQRQRERAENKTNRRAERAKATERRQKHSRREQRSRKQEGRGLARDARQAARADRKAARQAGRSERATARQASRSATAATIATGAAETAEYTTKAAADLVGDVAAGAHDFGMEYGDEALAAVGSMYGMDLGQAEAYAGLTDDELAPEDDTADDSGPLGLPWLAWAGIVGVGAVMLTGDTKKKKTKAKE